MNIASVVITVGNIAIFAVLGGFVGLVTAHITATLMARRWPSQYDKEIFIDLASILYTIFGAIAGAFAGHVGPTYGLLYLLGEAVSIPILIPVFLGMSWVIDMALSCAIKAWLKLVSRTVDFYRAHSVLATGVRYAVKAGLKLSNRFVEYWTPPSAG